MKYLLVLFLFPFIFLFHQASATSEVEKYPIIMVIPSESCQKVIKYHMKSDCPTDDMLIKYDTSNQLISGHFITKDGITVRTNPEVKNHWVWYKNETVCVDCTGDFMNPDLYKMIIIEPHGFTFIDKYALVPNHQWNSYSDRHMAGCNTATIAYSDSLLNDTIHYMESNCTITKFNSTKINVIPSQPWDFDNPYSSLHYKSTIDLIKKVSIGNCINGCTVTTSTKKW